MRGDLGDLGTLVTDRLDKKHIIITDSVKCAGHYPFILVLKLPLINLFLWRNFKSWSNELKISDPLLCS